MARCEVRPTSESMRQLGFKPRPMVRWFDPKQLLQMAVRGGVSAVFGEWADKREMQAALHPSDTTIDYSELRPGRLRDGPVCIDFVADVGDGWDAAYSVAWTLQRDLALGGTPTHRPELLVVGGDAVYPTPARDEYTNRFVGPYKSALPHTGPHPDAPIVLGIPGNHDWFDGLTSFIRLFCQGPGQWIGGWETLQRRSYFALKLSPKWWLWGIDIQLDSRIDRPQLEYFGQASAKLGADHQVILCTGKPAWVPTGEPEPLRNLEFFLETVVRPTGAKVPLLLSGDMHHYARYSAGEDSHLVTAGHGGAYLYPTHALEPTVAFSGADGIETSHQLKSVFPSVTRSRRLRWGALAFPFRNWQFALLVGCFHGLVIGGLEVARWLRRGSFLDDLAAASVMSVWSVFARTFARSKVDAAAVLVVPLVLGLLVVGLVAWPTIASKYAKRPWYVGAIVGLGHAAIQATMILVVAWLAVQWLHGNLRFALLVIQLLIGGLVGTLIIGLYLALADWTLGLHSNEAFAVQSNPDYKGFVRLRLDPDESLHVFAVGIPNACKKWRFTGSTTERSDAPWFEPEAGAIPFELVDRFSISPGSVGPGDDEALPTTATPTVDPADSPARS